MTTEAILIFMLGKSDPSLQNKRFRSQIPNDGQLRLQDKHFSLFFWQTVFYTVLYTWIKSQQFGCVQFASVESFYFQKPTGLLSKGSMCKTMKVSLPKHEDGRKQIWFATNTGCTWGSAAALQHRANIRRVTHRPSNCCQSCVTSASHNDVVRADVLFSRIIFPPPRFKISLDFFSNSGWCRSIIWAAQMLRSSMRVELPLSCVIKAAIQIPKLWHHINSQYQYFQCRGWLL